MCLERYLSAHRHNDYAFFLEDLLLVYVDQQTVSFVLRVVRQVDVIVVAKKILQYTNFLVIVNFVQIPSNCEFCANSSRNA